MSIGCLQSVCERADAAGVLPGAGNRDIRIAGILRGADTGEKLFFLKKSALHSRL